MQRSNHAADGPAPAGPKIAEHAATWCFVAWFLVVGVVTYTVVHHIIQAIPIVAIAVAPKSVWVRHTAAMAGMAWIVMLAMFSPMISIAMFEGVDFTRRDRAFTWLAPGMAILAAAWSSVHLALLGRTRWWVWLGVLLAAGVVLGAAQPAVGLVLQVPLNQVFIGEFLWVPVLMLVAGIALLIPWSVARLATRKPRPRVTGGIIAMQAGYWTLFIVCVIGGIAITAL